MKLIRWVEVHIGRSRRKTKKDKDGSDIKVGLGSGADIPRRRDESTPSTPLHKVEPLGKDLSAPLSAGSTPHRKHPPSPHPLKAPDTPSLGSRDPNRRALHIRTSFLDTAAVSEVGSPRQRSRIRTNPWLPSPRSSGGGADCGWVGNGGGGGGGCGNGGNRSSSIGSESSESIAGSGFGSQSSGSLWEGYAGDPWTAAFRCGRSPSIARLPRVTLERSSTSRRQQQQQHIVEPDQLSFGDEDRPYCPVTYCRPIPRSAWMDFREITNDNLDESSDEAYSEDYVHSEDHEGEEGDADPPPPQLPLKGVSEKDAHPQDTGSPQADSACGSDRDNSSCSTTPLSEIGPQSDTTRSLTDARELLQDKVQRLRVERHLVDQRMQEAREEEIMRREEHLLLQRELVQFRRLLLLQTLTELRAQLERQGKRLQRAYSTTLDMGMDGSDEDWVQVQTDIM